MASAYIDKISVGGKEYIISDSNTQSMIANAYNTAVSYVPKDVCIYENKLYKCIGETSGAFNPTKWENVNLTEAGLGGDDDSKLSLSGGTLTGPLVGTTITADTITANKLYGAVWNDYAEWFEKQNVNDSFEVGDICSWDENGVILAGKYDPCVVGVVSNTYGHILGGNPMANMEDNHKKFVPIGLVGRLQVKVIGPVEKGDLIVSYNNGVGCVDNMSSNRFVIGKALESSLDENIKLIKVLIK